MYRNYDNKYSIKDNDESKNKTNSDDVTISN